MNTDKLDWKNVRVFLAGQELIGIKSVEYHNDTSIIYSGNTQSKNSELVVIVDSLGGEVRGFEGQITIDRKSLIELQEEFKYELKKMEPIIDLLSTKQNYKGEMIPISNRTQRRNNARKNRS